jgi:hypothetical protein
MPTRFCRHIRINGERCGSPALRSEVFCYFHVELGKRHRRQRPHHDAIPTIVHPMTLQDGTQREPHTVEYDSANAPAPLALDFPPLEDRHSIQLALSMLTNAVAQDRIDPKRAALLFYGLQIASSNARDLNPLPPPRQRTAKVDETILDEASGLQIAPDEDPKEIDDYERKGTATLYYEKILREWPEKMRLEELEAQKKAQATAAGTQQVP